MGISSGLGGSVGAVPAGAVMPFAGASAPAGWLLCFGQNVSRSQYGELFAVLGTTYGSGDGSTTFALPDLRGRVVAGVDNMGGTAASRLTSTTITGGGDAVGEVGGAQTHTLTTSEMPSHTHTQNAHSHGYKPISNLASNNGQWHFTADTLSGGDGTTGGGTNATTSETATNQNTGGGSAHNNVQPTMVLNYIIKA
jgi:microcystin-dependent protein